MISMRLMLSLFLVAGCVLLHSLLPVFHSAEPANPAVEVRLNNSYSELPLTFEANDGQADAQVRFLSRGAGHNLFLTSTGIMLALNQPSDADSQAVVWM